MDHGHAVDAPRLLRPASVTGKPIEVGGSLGRIEATGRGVTICAMAALEHLGRLPHQTRVAVQGFGNVGSISAKLLEESGCTVVAVSEDYGGIYNPLGLSIKRVLEYRAREKTLNGFPGAQEIGNQELLGVDCDLLVPAAIGNQLTSRNARDVKAKLIVEGANGPTTPEADAIFRERDIFVVPDILANAGGVTVSYFEWVQDLQSFFWSEHEVNQKLKAILSRAFSEVLKTKLEKKLDMRMAAYCRAVSRVAGATRERGLYPLDLSGPEAPDAQGQHEREPDDHPREECDRWRIDRRERVGASHRPGRAQRRQECVRLHRVDRAAPQAVGRQQQVADHADVLHRLVLQPGADVSDDACDPAHEPRDERDDSARDAREACRQGQAEGEQHEAFSSDVQDELDRVRRQVAGRPVDRGELEECRAGGVDRDQHGKPEPLSDHDLAAAHRAGQHRKQKAALDLARDQRSGDDRRAQREHAAVHERDDDQQLRGDQRDLLGRERRAVAAGHRRDLVESPRGEADDDQREDDQREEQAGVAMPPGW